MIVSLLLHVTILVLAMLIEDIAVVFDFAGTIGCSFISYFFPAIGYLLALRAYGTPRIYAKWQTRAYQAVAWLFIAIGTTAVISYIVSCSLKIAGLIPKEHTQTNLTI